MNTWQKIIVGFGLLGVWAYFAWLGKTDVQPLIDTIKLAAYSLGLITVTLTNPSKPKE